MPSLWTGREIASLTRGELTGDDCDIHGISIDTRTLKRGDLFIALQGPQHDGHEFAQIAVDNGAASILVSHDCGLKNQIVVGDTLVALRDLGAGARMRSDARIFAVTGSVGKTTAKEMLATLLPILGKTHAAQASLNNHWGVPLSLARMPRDCDYAVFEIGMNHAGEIGPLSRLVSPHVAIITNIAAVHIEHLQTLENIATAKAEIFQGMATDGIAILPRDSDQFPTLLAAARTQGIQTIRTFGRHADADARLLTARQNGDHLEIAAVMDGEPVQFALGMPGAHHAMNALAVLAAMAASGCDIKKPLPVLAALTPVSGRGNRFDVIVEPGQPAVTVIDETHNASPVAMTAALQTLGELPAKGRRIALLGDMLELGKDSGIFHAGLKPAIDAAGVDLVATCGLFMKQLAETLDPRQSQHYPDSAALVQDIAALVGPGDIVLVKGSRGSRMRLVIDALQRLGQIETEIPSPS